LLKKTDKPVLKIYIDLTIIPAKIEKKV